MTPIPLDPKLLQVINDELERLHRLAIVTTNQDRKNELIRKIDSFHKILLLAGNMPLVVPADK